MSARSVVVALWLLICFAVSESPAADATSPDDAVRLVAQLGDADFAIREEASEQLIEMGLPAIAAIEAELKNRDREIRYRCRRLLVVIRENDFQSRLDAFARSSDGNADFGLPAWPAYRAVLGDDADARALFVEMQKSESELLSLLDRDPRAASDLLTVRGLQRQQEMQVTQRQLTFGDMAALLFVAGCEQVAVSPQASSNIFSFCYQNSLRFELTTNRRHRDRARLLLGRWIARGEDATAYQGLSLAMQYEIKEGLLPARRMLNRDGQPPHILNYATLTIAKLGGRQDATLLTRLLENETRVSQFRIAKGNKVLDIQVRDVALAALLHLHEQEFKEFGFNHIQPNPQTVFNANTACFETDQQRTAAIERWREFRAKQANASS